MQSTKNVEKRKFDLLKFWFLIKYIIKNVLTHCVHFYLISCFQDQLSHFIACISLCAKYVIKAFQRKKMKNNEVVYLKWRIESNCFLKKGSLLQWKSIFVWSKRHLRLSRRARGDWIPPNSGPILGLKSVWVLDVALPFVNLKKE